MNLWLLLSLVTAVISEQHSITTSCSSTNVTSFIANTTTDETPVAEPPSVLPKASKLNLRQSGSNILELVDDLSLNVSKGDALTDEEKSYFLTFEEWKKQKALELAKQSQDEEQEIQRQRQERIRAHRRQDTSNLDAPVGEEGEFEASMFSDEEDESTSDKTYKGRFNYASFDCAATIVKTNKEARGANAVLNDNKDTYLLNQCKSQSKYVVIELCEDILVDEVALGNYEFFSSGFKDFRISVSDSFPTNSWTVLGEFTADNVRTLQLFKIADPKIWAKFLKLDVLSYYGHEYYCPISAVQVHGKSMMEQFKDENRDVDFDKRVEEIAVPGNDKPQFALEFKDPDNFQLAVEPEDECAMHSPMLGLDQFLETFKRVDDEKCAAIAENSTTTKLHSNSNSQESIYRSIVNRLSLLEANATLSLLYIEEQSKLLSKAFDNLETRQTSQFDKLLGQVNSTVQLQFTNFKRMNTELAANFEQLFDYQNKRFEDLLKGSDSKLGSFHRSLNFQKMLNLINFLVITLLVMYIITSRESELPRDNSGVFNLRAWSPMKQEPNILVTDLSYRNTPKDVTFDLSSLGDNTANDSSLNYASADTSVNTAVDASFNDTFASARSNVTSASQDDSVDHIANTSLKPADNSLDTADTSLGTVSTSLDTASISTTTSEAGTN